MELPTSELPESCNDKDLPQTIDANQKKKIRKLLKIMLIELMMIIMNMMIDIVGRHHWELNVPYTIIQMMIVALFFSVSPGSAEMIINSLFN